MTGDNFEKSSDTLRFHNYTLCAYNQYLNKLSTSYKVYIFVHVLKYNT